MPAGGRSYLIYRSTNYSASEPICPPHTQFLGARRFSCAFLRGAYVRAGHKSGRAPEKKWNRHCRRPSQTVAHSRFGDFKRNGLFRICLSRRLLIRSSTPSFSRILIVLTGHRPPLPPRGILFLIPLQEGPLHAGTVRAPTDISFLNTQSAKENLHEHKIH